MTAEEEPEVTPERLSERLDEADRRWQVFATKTWRLLRLMLLASLIPAALFTYLLAVNGDRADEAKRLSAQSAVLSRQAKTLSVQIQEERRRSLRASCLQDNHRHDRTIRKLDVLIADLPPGQREAARAGRFFTVALIEALAPRSNCRLLVSERVGRRRPSGITPP